MSRSSARARAPRDDPDGIARRGDSGPAALNATRLVVVRHGETAWNVDTRIQGQLDIDLNDTGRRQARQVAGALAEWTRAGGPGIADAPPAVMARAFRHAR